MKFDYFTYTIASHYAPAIINDDWTGLEDDEAEALQSWIDDLPKGVEYWETTDGGGSFDRDEVSGLLANCVSIHGYFRA
jgi:hypothetical protein